jgi:hypothetical protein
MKNYDINHVMVVYTGEKEELSDMNTWSFLFFIAIRNLVGIIMHIEKSLVAELLFKINMQRENEKNIPKDG